MNKYLIAISLLLFALLPGRPAEARLTLGVVAGADGVSGAVTPAQAEALADQLSEKLQEEVVVKTLADTATLIGWLDRFAMLDLALLPTADVKANAGKLMVIGPLGEQGMLSLVCRQGSGGDLPQRAAKVVREAGFEPWRLPGDTVREAAQVAQERTPAAADKMLPAEEVAATTDLQQLPPMPPGRAWTPQGDAYRDLLPTEEPAVTPLVLGLLPAPAGVLRSARQAEQLATYLGTILPVSVKVREFSRLETFAEWFLRYRMVDLAIIAPETADANLDGDYQPVVRLLRTDRPGMESSELVVLRRGQNDALLVLLQQAFLEMPQRTGGRELLAALSIGEVRAMGGAPAALPPVAEAPAETREVPAVPGPPPAEPVAADLGPAAVVLPSPAPEYEPPVEPTAPPREIAVDLPELPVAMPPPVRPAEVAATGVLAAIPAAPARPALAGDALPVPPDESVRRLPQAPSAPTAAVPPTLPAAPEPVAATPVAVPAQPLPTLPAVAEPVLPTLAPTSPLSSEPPMVVSAPAAEPETPVEEPVAPAVEPPAENTPAAEPFPPVEPAAALPVKPLADEQEQIVTETLPIAEAVPSADASGAPAGMTIGQETPLPDDEVLALLGEDTVAAMVAQPDIPQELRPPGVPVIRPGRIPKPVTSTEDELLVASMPEPLTRVEPPRPPKLLPEPEPEPGIIYVLPFVSVMVPKEVNDRVFDQFIDALIVQGAPLGLQFVILKEGLQRVSPAWLAPRKYVTGEIYAYVEEAGSTRTELRGKARLIYRRPNQKTPAYGFEYPARGFFDHDRSSLDDERIKLADDMAAALAAGLLKALQN